MAKEKKKPFYKRWWFILLVIIIGIGAINSSGDNASLSKQLFPTFIINSILLNANYTSLITPSRWFTADAQDKSFLKLRDFVRENNNRMLEEIEKIINE